MADVSYISSMSGSLSEYPLILGVARQDHGRLALEVERFALGMGQLRDK